MIDHQKDLAEIHELFIKVFQHKAGQEELDFVRTWVAKDINNRKTYEDYREVWNAAQRTQSANDYNPESAWNKLASQMKAQQEKLEETKTIPIYEEEPEVENKFWIKLLQIAAVAVVAFGLGMFAVQMTKPAAQKEAVPVFSEHIVPLGAKAQVVLPDGTKVWLNAGSSLKYSQNYNHEIREVQLQGEAYFDVKPNKQIPFWVITYGAKIKVVGTAFNVKAYKEENKIEATVERGEIKIYGKEELELKDTEIKLSVKQKLDIPTKKLNVAANTSNVRAKEALPEMPTLKENVATELYTSWKDKQWIIEREELGSLATKIERRYDVRIHFESEELKHNVFSGLIENETLDQLLRAVCFTSPITYKLDKKDVYLKCHRQ